MTEKDLPYVPGRDDEVGRDPALDDELGFDHGEHRLVGTCEHCGKEIHEGVVGHTCEDGFRWHRDGEGIAPVDEPVLCCDGGEPEAGDSAAGQTGSAPGQTPGVAPAQPLRTDGGMDYDQLLQEALARVEQVRRNATDDDTAAAGPVVREELKAIERRLHLVRFALASWQPESSSGEKELSTDGGVDAPGTLHRVVRARKLLGETDRDAFSTRGGARILNALEALDNLLLDDLDRFVAGCEQNELATDGGEDLADASDDVDAEEWERSRKRHGLRSSIPVHVDVDVPRAAWDLVRDRDDPMAGLLDFLEHEYRVSVDGEEVHRTAGYREAAEE